MIGKYLKPFVLLLGLLWMIGFAFIVGEGTQQQNERLKIETAQRAGKKQVRTEGEEQSGPQAGNRSDLGGEVTFTGLRLGEAILAFITVLLWLATRDLVRTSREISHQQLRAFVVAKGFSQAGNIHRNANGQPYIREWVFWYDIENMGLTPATGMKAWIQYQILPISENREPHFEWIGEGNTGVIGPRGAGKSGYCPIPLAAMVDLWERKVEIYLAGRVEYRDVFDPSIVHHHEQCAMLDLVRHPADVEMEPGAEKNLARVIMRIYGPQNTVG